jgi:hypothetical protein
MEPETRGTGSTIICEIAIDKVTDRREQGEYTVYTKNRRWKRVYEGKEFREVKELARRRWKIVLRERVGRRSRSRLRSSCDMEKDDEKEKRYQVKRVRRR